MGRRVSSRKEILQSPLIGVMDVARLMGISYPTAAKVYAKAQAIDSAELGDLLTIHHKVRTTSVLKVCGVTMEQMNQFAKGD